MSGSRALPMIALSVSTTVTVVVLTLFLHRTFASPLTKSDDRYQQGELFFQVLERLSSEYVSEVDDWDLIYRGLEGMLGSLDPYCRFYDPKDRQRFDEDTNGEYTGIGMVIHTGLEPVTVLYAFPGSPAEGAGLEPGDRIISCDGHSLETLGLDGSQNLIKGPPGTEITIEFVKASSGETVQATLERRAITQPSVFGTRFIDEAREIGYLRVRGFQKQTDREFVEAIDGLVAQGARSVVIDLRNNSGGLLDQAILMANRFLDDGVIVSLEGRAPRNTHVHEVDEDEVRFDDLEVVILINGQTASAAEVMAGALQDHKRGLLVGTRSYGKGVVQSVVSLKTSDGREVAMKYTTAYYVTPGGQRIERTVGQDGDKRGGLEPDFQAPLKESELAAVELAQLQMEYPDQHRSEVIALKGRKPEPLDDAQLQVAIDLLSGRRALRKIESR